MCKPALPPKSMLCDLGHRTAQVSIVWALGQNKTILIAATVMIRSDNCENSLERVMHV